jgi:peroxiredoxin
MPEPHTPAVGDIAPEISTTDSTGATRTFADLCGGERLTLIFFRGHW